MPIQAQFSDIVHLLTPEYSRYSWTSLSRPKTILEYKKWIELNYHGQMKFLEEHSSIKEFPQKLDTSLVGAISLTLQYVPHPAPKSLPLKQARIALYAQGEDYHLFFLKKLRTTCDQLSKMFPDDVFLPFTDSGPVLERDLAQKAGLGWFGKNTCLINRQDGSLFLIGEILTSKQFSYQTPENLDFCGKCQKCIEACPTQAIEAPHLLNANKCISYWTIESKVPAPENLRPQIGDWLFGCDICQTVCPWNQKAFGKVFNSEPIRTLEEDHQKELVADLKWILTTSNKQIDKLLDGTPLLRAGGRGLKKNALIVIGNYRFKELLPEVKLLEQNPRYTELAQWTLRQINQEAF